MATSITLTVGGPREKITKEEAEQIKARFEKELAEGTGVVEKLDLSCRQWSVEAITVLRDVLEKVAPTVVYLDLNDTIAGLETSKGFEIMELWTDIFKTAAAVETIDMSDNACGPRVLKRVAPLLGSPTLKKLYFNNCGLSAETMPQLDDALKVEGVGKGVARLEELQLDRNMIGIQGAKGVGELLKDCLEMTSFSYCGCRPENEGTKYICDGLKNLVEENPDAEFKMSQLSLEDCTFGGGDDTDTLKSFGKALEKFPMLTHLNIRDGGDLGEVGTGIVSQALSLSNCKLEELDFSGCSLGIDGAETLAEMIREKMLGSLKVLKLETNELENDGVEKIVAAFDGKNCLEHLRLDENELDEGAIDILLDAELPKLTLLTLKENMDLEEADDDKKQKLRDHFSKAKICIADDDDEAAEVQEKDDADVNDLADQFGKL